MSRTLGRAALVAVALATFAVSPSAQDSLLRRSDVGAFVPQSMRARLTLARGGDAATSVEIFRSGANRTLLRFLAPKERGKFLLRRDGDLWLIAPGAKRPVKLGPTHRVYGAATIDVLFSLRLADDYEVVSVTEEPAAGGPHTVFELRAKSAAAPFGEVRYTVHTPTARPESAVYRVRSGRPTTRVLFRGWSRDGAYAQRIEVEDLVRRGPATRIEVSAFEAGPLPAGLFDLEDGSLRQALGDQDGQRLRKQNH